MGWSVRTMRRRISRLHEQLGAANRFQAGVIAARRGWIEGPATDLVSGPVPHVFNAS